MILRKLDINSNKLKISFTVLWNSKTREHISCHCPVNDFFRYDSKSIGDKSKNRKKFKLKSSGHHREKKKNKQSERQAVEHMQM